MLSYNALVASIVITTKNRKQELLRALTSAVAQVGNVEVLVIDDGSTDGTAEMVRAEFSQVRLHRDESSLGLIYQRNRAAKLATGDIIVSIDDDAEFSDAGTVEAVKLAFQDPRVGAVAMSYIDCTRGDTVHSRAPDANDLYVVGTFIGTAHAVRRDLFLQLGGYRDELIYGGEESDYSLRLLDAGYATVLGTVPPILHRESPRRPSARGHVYRARSAIMRTVWNIPMPYLPLHLAGATLAAIRSGVKSRHPLWCIAGLARGYWGALRTVGLRNPVSVATYKISRAMSSKPIRIGLVFPATGERK